LFTYKLVIESTAFLTPALTYASYAAMGMDTSQFYTEDAAKATAYAAVSSPLAFSNALASVFVEETKDKGYIEALTAVTEDIINSYKDMMNNCNWSSASAKEGLLKKIENMRMNILVPDSGYADFSGVKLKTTEEGGNLLESYLTMKKYNQQQENLLIGKPASSDAAWNMMGASTVNAFYDSDTNSVNIMPGFVSDLVCDLNSVENLYAAIGTVVGHEISHGFDVMGSQYDYNGKRNAVFTGADKDAYLTHINDFNAYLSSVQIADGVQCNGELISSEATADLCGMAVVLNALKDKEGFNYEQFFATNAIMYARTMPGNVSVMLNTSDGHPQNYIRINVINQMFEEFYTTFSVTEADGMYLAPEARSTVWW
ncbi:MAG: hypothetical protein HUJ75_05480, partial [Parasporobacterium sp.]|nr:hypothetical protein [Parasporobacterium sp.]